MIRKPNGNIVELDTVSGGIVLIDISKVAAILYNENEAGDIEVEVIFDGTKNFVQTTVDINNYARLANRYREVPD